MWEIKLGSAIMLQFVSRCQPNGCQPVSFELYNDHESVPSHAAGDAGQLQSLACFIFFMSVLLQLMLFAFVSSFPNFQCWLT